MLPDQSGERLNGDEACKEVPSVNQEVLVELDHWGDAWRKRALEASLPANGIAGGPGELVHWIGALLIHIVMVCFPFQMGLYWYILSNDKFM